MKNSDHFDTATGDLTVIENEDINSFHGNPEIVNFPSTSEIFQAVFENKYYANCIGNGRGQTLKANAQACKIFGYTPDEMRRLSVNSLFDTGTKDYTSYVSVRNRERRAKSTVIGIRKNGDHFPCEILSLIYFDDKGEKRTLNTLRDLSKNYSTTYLE